MPTNWCSGADLATTPYTRLASVRLRLTAILPTTDGGHQSCAAFPWFSPSPGDSTLQKSRWILSRVWASCWGVVPWLKLNSIDTKSQGCIKLMISAWTSTGPLSLPEAIVFYIVCPGLQDAEYRESGTIHGPTCIGDIELDLIFGSHYSNSARLYQRPTPMVWGFYRFY